MSFFQAYVDGYKIKSVSDDDKGEAQSAYAGLTVPRTLIGGQSEACEMPRASHFLQAQP